MTHLTDTESIQLDNLIRRGANHLTPDERGHLLRLWDQHRTDDAQARRTLGGLNAKVQKLGSQLADYEQIIRNQHAELLGQADSPS